MSEASAPPADNRAKIDAAVRGPVLFLLGVAVCCLLAAAFLGVAGRSEASYHALLGWGLCAGTGLGVWIAARLRGARRAGYPSILYFSFALLAGALVAVNLPHALSSLRMACLFLGLGTAFYVFPKVLGRPLHSRSLALLALFTIPCGYLAGWARAFPAGDNPWTWTADIGVAATILMLIPALAVAVNLWKTAEGGLGLLALHRSPALRFSATGVAAWVLLACGAPLGAFRSTGAFFAPTVADGIGNDLAFWGFAAFAFAGASYYAAPRLARAEWPSSRLIVIHFWCLFLGLGLAVGALAVGGTLQGFGLADKVDPAAVASTLHPFLLLRRLASLFFLAGTTAFAANFAGLLSGRGRNREGPTLFSGR